MSVHAGQAKLKTAAKNLAARWQGVKMTWRDDQSRQFEEKYVASLLARLRTAEAAMGHIDMILSQVRRDCG